MARYLAKIVGGSEVRHIGKDSAFEVRSEDSLYVELHAYGVTLFVTFEKRKKNSTADHLILSVKPNRKRGDTDGVLFDGDPRMLYGDGDALVRAFAERQLKKMAGAE